MERCKICGNFVNDMAGHIRRKRCFDYFEKKDERGSKPLVRGGGRKGSNSRYSARRVKLEDKDVDKRIKEGLLERTKGVTK